MAYPPYRTTHDDFDDDDNFQRCRHCGAEYLDDPDEADHLSDCPSNPYGYNNERGREFLAQQFENCEEETERVAIIIPVYTGSEF